MHQSCSLEPTMPSLLHPLTLVCALVVVCVSAQSSAIGDSHCGKVSRIFRALSSSLLAEKSVLRVTASQPSSTMSKARLDTPCLSLAPHPTRLSLGGMASGRVSEWLGPT